MIRPWCAGRIRHVPKASLRRARSPAPGADWSFNPRCRAARPPRSRPSCSAYDVGCSSSGAAAVRSDTRAESAPQPSVADSGRVAVVGVDEHVDTTTEVGLVRRIELDAEDRAAGLTLNGDDAIVLAFADDVVATAEYAPSHVVRHQRARSKRCARNCAI